MARPPVQLCHELFMIFEKCHDGTASPELKTLIDQRANELKNAGWEDEWVDFFIGAAHSMSKPGINTWIAFDSDN